MFDFLGSIFEPVVSFVVDKTNNVVGAIVGAALEGAVAGAFSGALVSAVKGENVFKGALKGAALGGIIAGGVSSLGQLSGMESFTADNQLKTMGFKSAPVDTIKENLQYGSGSFDPKDTTQGILSSTGSKYVPSGNSYTSSTNNTSSKMMDFLKTDTGGKMIAGIGQGAAQGAGQYLAAKEQAEGNRDNILLQDQLQKERIAANQPSDFKARTANITMRKWWDDRIKEDTSAITRGTTPQQQPILGVA